MHTHVSFVCICLNRTIGILIINYYIFMRSILQLQVFKKFPLLKHVHLTFKYFLIFSQKKIELFFHLTFNFSLKFKAKYLNLSFRINIFVLHFWKKKTVCRNKIKSCVRICHHFQLTGIGLSSNQWQISSKEAFWFFNLKKFDLCKTHGRYLYF